MGGGTAQSQQQSQQQLTPQQQKLVSMAMPSWAQFAGSNIQMPGGSQSVAPFSPWQMQGMDAAAASTGLNPGSSSFNTPYSGVFTPPPPGPTGEQASGLRGQFAGGGWNPTGTAVPFSTGAQFNMPSATGAQTQFDASGPTAGAPASGAGVTGPSYGGTVTPMGDGMSGPGGGGGTTGSPTMQNVVGTAAGTENYLSSGAFLDPGSNPYVQNAVKAATAPIFQDLSERTLPADQATAAAGSGVNYGGSREGIKEGLDVQGAQRAAGQTGANIMNTALGQGLNATGQAIGQAPGTAGSLGLPGEFLSALGGAQQQQFQNWLNSQNAASMFQQLLPLFKGQALTQGAGALPGGGATTTASGSSDPGLWANILGGVTALGSLFGGKK